MFSLRNKKDINSFRMKKSALSVAIYVMSEDDVTEKAKEHKTESEENMQRLFAEVLLMSIHNMCFPKKIRKLFFWIHFYLEL